MNGRTHTAIPVALDRARLLAGQVVKWAAPFCHRVELAGALARGEPLVTFVDLVVAEKFTTEADVGGLEIRLSLLDESLRTLRRRDVARVLEFPELIDGHPRQTCHLFRRISLLFEPPVRVPVRIVRAGGLHDFGGLLALACATPAELKRLRAAAHKQSRYITPNGVLMGARSLTQKFFASPREFYSQLRLEPPRWLAGGHTITARERSGHGQL